MCTSAESLRSTTPSSYQPLSQQPQAGTASADVATAGVTSASSNLQTTSGTQPLPQGTGIAMSLLTFYLGPLMLNQCHLHQAWRLGGMSGSFIHSLNDFHFTDVLSDPRA